jgi:hypothetical protein
LEKTKFIIVDLKLNRYVCALGDDYHGLIDTKKVHAAWSMDRTQVIIRVPLIGGTSALDFYKSINNKYLICIEFFFFLFSSCKKRSKALSSNYFN